MALMLFSGDRCWSAPCPVGFAGAFVYSRYWAAASVDDEGSPCPRPLAVALGEVRRDSHTRHIDLRTSHHLRRATIAHTPSTTPNGQVPASQPYKEEAPQAIAKTSTHQGERFSRAYDISMIVTAHAPKKVSELICHLPSLLYPYDICYSTQNACILISYATG